MSRACRIIEGGSCEITQGYSDRHRGMDLVNKGYTLGWLVAHSAGTVVAVESNINYNTYPNGAVIYGNYVKIKHDGGYYTLYGHIAYGTIKVSVGQRVSKGARIGYMGNTGYSTGGHVHFEVRNTSDTKINPDAYLNADLPNQPGPAPTPTKKYNVGDLVNINGVYVSSTSTNKLSPAVTQGTITRIVDARNPYLLDNGNIGWVNDDCIINKVLPTTYKTIGNCYWLNLRTSPAYGDNIYKAVQAGTRVEYIGMESGWAKIRYDNRTLYCGSSYLV